MLRDSSYNYYMHDLHGNVIETYGSNKNYPDNFCFYNAFGTNKYFDDTSAPNKWGYCDQLKDFETGNYYMRARYYNPDTGRFISEDTHWNPSNMIYGDRTFEEDETKYPDITASLQAGNLYGYCLGNPVRYSDSDGEAVYGSGISGALGLGITISGQVYYVYDDQGNHGIMLSAGLGGGVSFDASTNGAVTGNGGMIFEDMDNIYQLEGAGSEFSIFGSGKVNSGGEYSGVNISGFGIDLRVSFTGTKVFSVDGFIDWTKSVLKAAISKIF